MNKLVLPKNPYRGIKVFCRVCNADNTGCKHYESQVFRVRVHVPGSKNTVKTKKLESLQYADAVAEAIAFEKTLNATEFTTVGKIVENNINEDQGNDYSLIDSIIKYSQFLNGNSEYAHLKKNITKGHKDELLRYCRYFLKNIKKTKDVKTFRVKNVGRKEVSSFYLWAEKHYNEKTFNKCMIGMKGFFAFLIDEEDIDMKNPFRKYTAKQIPHSEINAVTKEEFEAIIKAVDDNSARIAVLGGKGEHKNMFRSYLKDGFKLFLLVGGRREEVVDLRWNNIFLSPNGTKFFRIKNLKVIRAKKTAEEIYKYTPINSDLFELLLELGYNEKRGSKDYVLFPERKIEMKSLTICNDLSKGFTHYRKAAGIEREIRLGDLRKTYLTWVNQVMNQDTKILSSHSTDGVLQEYYLDPTILNAIEKGALEIKIFG
ncbi:tyrosine-type recombinase/integrase [Flavobacterium aquidurense]|uniref:tyrosine-type recombinase/integrase n=1 Tax=Flavobacterium aquidurense TaxID=362413 RepID=UPI00371348EA